MSKTAARREKMLSLVQKTLPSATQQLDLFEQFAKATPDKYTHTLELFDAIPKFSLGAVSNLRRKGPLDIVRREFTYGSRRLRVTIEPTVLETKVKGVLTRKEILPGAREEQVYRVLRKMASDPFSERHIREGRNPSIALSFNLNQLRVGLRKVGHEYRISEIKEALQVLSRTPIKLLNLDTNKELYSSGSYLDVEYTGDADDENGVTRVCVSFNRLAAAAILEGISDWLHYERLMSLHDPLAEWIYEHMTRNFRQAGAGTGYNLTLRKILAESPMSAYRQIRDNVRRVRQALTVLTEKGVLSAFPPPEEKLQHAPSKGGRAPVVDCTWTIYPSDDVVADIKADNARKCRIDVRPARVR